MENTLAVFSNMKHKHATQYSNSTPRYLHENWKHIFIKNLNIGIHVNITPKSKVATTHLSINSEQELVLAMVLKQLPFHLLLFKHSISKNSIVFLNNPFKTLQIVPCVDHAWVLNIN